MINRRAIGKVALTICAAVLIIGVLVLRSDLSENGKNGFTRKLYSRRAINMVYSENELHLVSMLGKDGDTMYMRSLDNFYKVFIVKGEMKIWPYFLVVPKGQKEDKIFTSFIKSSTLISFYTNEHVILSNRIGSRFTTVDSIRGNACYHICPITDSTFIYRSPVKQTERLRSPVAFTKERIGRGIETSIPDTLLTSDPNDMGTDGLYGFDPISHQSVYMCFYNNNLIKLDSNLEARRYNSIDTFSTNRTIMGLVARGQKQLVTNIAPAHFVNWCISAYQNVFYINSRVPSDNDKNIGLKDGDIIDVYSMTDGHYLGSFKLPLAGYEHLLSMYVDMTGVWVLYRKHIAYFQFV